MVSNSFLLSYLAGLSTAAVLHHKPVRITSAPTVRLSSGVVVGTTTAQTLPWLPHVTTIVDEFLGVPYAAPPLRFAPPTSPTPWKQPLNATAFKPACLQYFNSSFVKQFADSPPAPESEDCLYVNVWTPSGEPADRGGRPVMFWIYGGGLSFGWSGQPAYDGATLAASQDVVVVSLGYRMNVFGFSNSPEIPLGKQNSGFLDQRFALEWVQKNIAKFGGNPSKVTIFGESAGGYSVKQLLALPPKPLTYSGAIIESEGTYRAVPNAWATLTTYLNCASAPSPLSCMRALPATTIQTAITNLSLIFQPVPDNITSSSNVATQITTGTWAQVPFIIGTNANEGTFFQIGQTNTLAFLKATFPGLTPLQQAILAQYPQDYNAYQEISDIFTNFVFLCPAGDIAALAVSKGYKDVFRYYFNASFPNYLPFPGAGVWHTSEVPLVFGTYPRVNATQQQMDLSVYFQAAWAGFARFGTPGWGWPRYLSAERSVMDIGVNGTDGGVLVSNNTVDGKCPVYQALIPRVGL